MSAPTHPLPPAVPALRSSTARLASPELLERATVVVCPWPDALVDHAGHDPRTPYAERYWLPVLGPSAPSTFGYT